MSLWQAMFGTCILLALVAGNAHWRIWLAMLSNYFATMFFAPEPYTVAAFDLLSAIILIGASNRANIAAALFSLMVPIYIFGQLAQWQMAATYAIVEGIAYVQLGVLANVDGGISRLYRRSRDFIRPRFGRNAYSMEVRSKAKQPSCMVSIRGKT